jgi:hypothetical protein
MRTLEGMGIIGAAAEAIAEETAEARHALRVSAAKEAALTEAERLFGNWLREESAQFVEANDGDSRWGEPFVHGQLRALAALLCLLDTAGIGGHDGVEGAATQRLACFSALGKGRKQARDGGAWSAAIAQAAEELLPGAMLYAPNGVVSLGVSNLNCGVEDAVSIALDPEQLQASGLAPWAMTVAREGLRLACGLQPWLGWRVRFQVDRLEDWNGLGMKPAEAWAQLVNELAAPVE